MQPYFPHPNEKSLNCKHCINEDCDIAGANNDLISPCYKSKLPNTICHSCKCKFDKRRAKKQFKGREILYQCPNCNNLNKYKYME